MAVTPSGPSLRNVKNRSRRFFTREKDTRLSVIHLGQPVRQVEVLAHPANLAVVNLEEGRGVEPVRLTASIRQAIVGGQVFATQGEFTGGAPPARLGEYLQIVQAFPVAALHALQILGEGLPALLTRALIDIQQHIVAEQRQAGTAVAFVKGIAVAGQQLVGKGGHGAISW